MMARMIWSASLFAAWSLMCCKGDTGAQVSALQKPHILNVTEGENVIMNCSYLVNSTETKQIRIRWFRNCCEPPVQENNNCSKIQDNIYNVTVDQQLLDSLSLTPVQRHQRGTYICEIVVEVPQLFMIIGNCTFLTIQAPDSPAALLIKECVSIILSTVLLAVGLVAIFFIIYWRKKGNNRNSSVQRKSDCQESGGSESDVHYAALNLSTSPCVSKTAAASPKNPNESPSAARGTGKVENADVIYSGICTPKHSTQSSC